MDEHQADLANITVMTLEIIAVLKKQKVQLCNGKSISKNIVDRIKQDSVNALNNLNEFTDGDTIPSNVPADLIEMLEDELDNLQQFNLE